MTHEQADWLERLHHFLYRTIRGRVTEAQYVGTVKMGEAELERVVFHPADVSYNWIAYWKRHEDGRNATGSWKLRYPDHSLYVDPGMQVHITLFQSTARDDWIDIYAHYEYDNLKHPLLHFREVDFSPALGVRRARSFFHDSGVQLHQLHGDQNA